MLISPASLRQHLDDPHWIVFDCRHDLSNFDRGLQLYRAGHLPGAFFAPVETVLSGRKSGSNGRHPLPPAGEFAAFLIRHGVNESTQIVAYDDVGGQYAARFWWMARWIGLTRTSILDGGYPKWIAEGHPVTSVEPLPRTGGAVIVHPDRMQQVDADEVLRGISGSSCLVLDARAPERYRGEVEPIDRVAGHIPGARNRFFRDNLNPDLTMRPVDELRVDFEAVLGDREPDEVVHQCGSGITACVNLFAMEYVGLVGSRLYVGSWSEWSADPTRPVARD